MSRKKQLVIDGEVFGTVRDHAGTFGLYQAMSEIHLFDGTIQHTDKYGHKLYLQQRNGKWEVTTVQTAMPYMYPKLYDNSSDLTNVFLMENREKFFAYPIADCGKIDADVQRESSTLLQFDIDSFVLENQYKYLGLLETMFEDYDPISNYDSYEKKTQTHGLETYNHTPVGLSGHTHTETTPAETSTTTTPDGQIKVEHYTTTYDDATQGRLADYTIQTGGTKAETSVDNNGVGDTTFNSETYTDTKTTETDGYELEKHGNIGVTSTQEMLDQERKIRRFSVLKEFSDELAKYICLSVYG